MLLAMSGCGACREPAQHQCQPSESLLAKLAMLPSLEALPHSPPASPVPGAPGQGQRLVPTFQLLALGMWAKQSPSIHTRLICLAPSHALEGSPALPQEPPPLCLGVPCLFPYLAGHASMPTAPLYAHCSSDSVSPFGCRGWGTSRPDTPAYSFSPRCMGVTRRTWAPLPRMRQPGCGCRRGTRPGPAAPRSCWNTARAAVPPVVVRITGTRAWVGTALRRHSLDTAAHTATVVQIEFLCCHGTPAPRTMPPARRAAGTQWPEIAGHTAGTGGPQPLYLGPCQGGCAGGRCMPSGAVCDCAVSWL